MSSNPPFQTPNVHCAVYTLFSDHFSFRPTGSTTSAIVCILHHAASLLSTNPCVSLIFYLDFQKPLTATGTLLVSTNFLLLTPLILSRTGVWLSIMDRSYVARLGTMTSSLVFINAGIVQRSGVDSFSYDVVSGV